MNNKESNKRDKVLKNNKKKKFRIELLIPILVLVVGIIFVINSQVKKDNKIFNFGNTLVSYEKVKAKEGKVELSASDFNDYKAKYFVYKFPDKDIFFFTVKSKDGIIRAAFDSCDVCYRAKKGYRQEGDVMICNNCGQIFPTDRINLEKGGCNPAPLVRELQGNKVVINVDDIYSGIKYF